MNRLDPRSPLVFDTRELSRRPGSMREVSRRIEAPAVLGTDVIAVAEGTPIDVELRFESVVEGVLVTGEATTVATGECVRCLGSLTQSVTASFQELFVHAERATRHRKTGGVDEENEEYFVVDDLIDLDEVLRDAVVPALSFQPVCREDCPGLCSQCGFTLAQDPTHTHELLDPRWLALTQMSSAASDVDRTDERRN